MSTKKYNLINSNQILFTRIFNIHLMPDLSTFEKFTSFRTVAGPDQSRSLYIEMDDNPNSFRHYEKNHSLEIIQTLS